MRRTVLSRRLIVGAATLMVALACSRSERAQAAPQRTSNPAPPALEVIVLGSGGPGATGRAASSYVLLLDGKPRILVDAGPGAFVRLGEAKLSMADLDVVLLTHLHVDHVGELPGLFKARAVSSRGPISFRVFGPEGRDGRGDDASFPSTSRWLDLLLGPRGAFPYLKNFSAPISWHVVDLPAKAKPGTAPRQILHEGKLTISASAGHHRDAPAIIYRVNYDGRSVTFSGDIDSQGIPALTTLAQASDLLVFNSVVLDPPESPEVLYTLHSSPRAIGAVAGTAGVKRLLLSHLSPAVDVARQSVLDSVAERFHGPVSFAEDGLRLGL